MVKRRSLDDALTPEEQAFVESGKPQSTPKRKQPVTKRDNPAMMPSVAIKEPPPAISPEPAAVSFALNTRIAAHLSNALLRAATDRKLQRLSSSTQRDIVEEALADWLRRNGYIK